MSVEHGEIAKIFASANTAGDEYSDNLINDIVEGGKASGTANQDLIQTPHTSTSTHRHTTPLPFSAVPHLSHRRLHHKKKYTVAHLDGISARF